MNLFYNLPYDIQLYIKELSNDLLKKDKINKIIKNINIFLKKKKILIHLIDNIKTYNYTEYNEYTPLRIIYYINIYDKHTFKILNLSSKILIGNENKEWWIRLLYKMVTSLNIEEYNQKSRINNINNLSYELCSKLDLYTKYINYIDTEKIFNKLFNKYYKYNK